MSEKIATVTVLGCGSSIGVPAPGNEWGNCNPQNPKNRRTRPSIWVHNDDVSVMIDVGADFTHQAIREEIKTIDAVLLTHAHSDHTDGMGDLRVYSRRQKQEIPVYGDGFTLNEVCRRFEYAFVSHSGLYPKMLDAREIEAGKNISIGGLEFTPYLQSHGLDVYSYGYRIGNFAYSTDMLDLPEESLELLQGVDVWIADCAAFVFENPLVHANLEIVTQLKKRVGAKKVYLTHMGMLIDYDDALSHCETGIEPAYDGLNIDIY